MVADGKKYSAKASCRFKVLEKEPELKVGRLHLLERGSKFGSINVSKSEIFVEGVANEEGRGLSLLFSIEPPLNDSMSSDLGSIRVVLYSASSSWYTIEISNFVNKTKRAVDVREKFFKKPLDVSIKISRERLTVENIDTGENLTLHPSEDWLRRIYGKNLEIYKTMTPPSYVIYGDTMTVSFKFGERSESVEYLLIETGFSPEIPKKPKVWVNVSD